MPDDCASLRGSKPVTLGREGGGILLCYLAETRKNYCSCPMLTVIKSLLPVPVRAVPRTLNGRRVATAQRCEIQTMSITRQEPRETALALEIGPTSRSSWPSTLDYLFFIHKVSVELMYFHSLNSLAVSQKLRNKITSKSPLAPPMRLPRSKTSSDSLIAT